MNLQPNNQEVQNVEPISIDFFTEIGKLGAGQSGKVMLYRYKPTKELRAIKLVQVSDTEFEREVLPFLHLNHDNLVRFYGVTNVAVFRGIIMEYMNGGTLQQVLHPEERAPYKYTLEDVLNWNIQIARALEYMHSKTYEGLDENNQPVYSRYIHRDLKPENIFLDDTYQTLKIGDFGFTKKIDSSRNTFGIGSPIYMAPEIMLRQTYNETADIYSFTLTFWECLTGVRPFPGCKTISKLREKKQEQIQLADVNAKANPKAKPEEREKANTASAKFNQLIQCCSKPDRNRLSMSSWRKLLEILYNNNDVGQRDAQANTICVGNDQEFFYCNLLEDFDWAAFDGNLAGFEEALNSLVE